MGGLIAISFVCDTGSGEWLHDHMIPPGLGFRTAVIQDTDVAGCDDMYFDEALWRGVVDFAARFDPEARVTVLPDFTVYDRALPKPGAIRALWDRLTGAPPQPQPPLPAVLRGEVEFADFVDDWMAQPADDRDPPPVILVRRDGELVLCVVTEYWSLIGGRAATYHDSYTYSVFAKEPLGDALQGFLTALPDAHSRQVIPARPA